MQLMVLLLIAVDMTVTILTGSAKTNLPKHGSLPTSGICRAILQSGDLLERADVPNT